MRFGKFFIGAVLIIVLVVLGVFAGNPKFFKGEFDIVSIPGVQFGPLPTTAVTCDHQWTKVFEGTYDWRSYRDARMLDVTQQNMQTLIAHIQNGCDMKMVFRAIPLGSYFDRSFFCESVESEVMPNQRRGSVECQFRFRLREGGMDYFEQHIYDSVIMSYENNGQVYIEKKRVNVVNQRAEEQPFFNMGLDQNQAWNVAVYTRK